MTSQMLSGVQIIGTGKADLDPDCFVDNYQLARELVDRKKTARGLLNVKRLPPGLSIKYNTSHKWIVNRTGIYQRPIVGDNIATSDLAISAAKNALKNANILAEQIGLIRLGTVTPDEIYSPPTVSRIAHGIGIPVWDIDGIKLHECIATDQSYACSTFPISLNDAVVYLTAGYCDYALVIGADKMSSANNPHNREIWPILADHGAAVILKRVPYEESGFKKEWFFAGGDGSESDKIIARYGGSRNPITPDYLKLDPLVEKSKIFMNGKSVFTDLVRLLKQNIIPEALEKAGLTPVNIDLALFHQANIRMIDPVEKYLRKLGFRDDAVVFNTIQNYGNTTCATIPLGIHDARVAGVLKKDMTVMIVAMGGGYSWVVTFLKWKI